ncbi:unnamed protein product [Alopecurus aequalis]
MKTRVLLVAATVATAAFASMCHPAQGATKTPPPATTIAGACQAAHDADSRVSTSFCITHLRKQSRTIDGFTRGLAEAAADVGVGNADAARYEAQRTLGRRDDEQEDPIYRRALERCDRLYGMVREAFAEARDLLVDHRDVTIEAALSSVASIAHSCDYGFSLARRAGASPLVQYSENNTQIALLTVVIAGLIK